ncbi:MAG: hypothetical protein ACU0BF_10010 [Paracoccaceae bacterium]
MIGRIAASAILALTLLPPDPARAQEPGVLSPGAAACLGIVMAWPHVAPAELTRVETFSLSRMVPYGNRFAMGGQLLSDDSRTLMRVRSFGLTPDQMTAAGDTVRDGPREITVLRDGTYFVQSPREASNQSPGNTVPLYLELRFNRVGCIDYAKRYAALMENGQTSRIIARRAAEIEAASDCEGRACTWLDTDFPDIRR